MKAIVLISGGLDSLLAARLIQEQGIEVIGLKFTMPFSASKRKNLESSGIATQEVDASQEFLELVEKPLYGYGKNLNPCIDCKIFMLSKAKSMMGECAADFIVTGEVLGQRPMSQNRQTMELIEEKADLEGLILRPLSGKLLAQTLPEKNGWISREKLLDFNGRSRQPQINLAQKFFIKDYAQPAGGCLLTDPEFSHRLKELIRHGELSLGNVELLKLGRHFRISPQSKLIVGRNEKENEVLLDSTAKDDYLFYPAKLKGPVALGRGVFNAELLALAAEIVSRYSDRETQEVTEIVYRQFPSETEKILMVSPLAETETLKLKISK